MSDLSDHAENLVATWLMTDDAVTRPASRYVGLYTVAPSDAGGGTEASGAGYERAAAGFAATSLAGVVANSGDIAISAVGGDFGTIVAVGVFDAASGGNLLAWKAVAPLPVTAGQSARFVAGSLQVRFQ